MRVDDDPIEREAVPYRRVKDGRIGVEGANEHAHGYDLDEVTDCDTRCPQICG
jgi:hypothetical protein